MGNKIHIHSFSYLILFFEFSLKNISYGEPPLNNCPNTRLLDKAKEILYNINKDHKSLATAITYERIKALNKKLRKKIKLNILDLADHANNPSGTKVIFEIPVIL